MKTKVIIVNGCRNCPYSVFPEEIEPYCYMKGGKNRDLNLVENLNINEKPKWCPLNKTNITIKLK